MICAQIDLNSIFIPSRFAIHHACYVFSFKSLSSIHEQLCETMHMWYIYQSHYT